MVKEREMRIEGSLSLMVLFLGSGDRLGGLGGLGAKRKGGEVEGYENVVDYGGEVGRGHSGGVRCWWI